jgi:flavin-binding protein dodecin
MSLLTWHTDPEEDGMHDHHVYKIVELVGSSPDSIEDAIKSAISRANATIRNLRWFEVVETRGHIENGNVHHYQVTLKVGFTLEDETTGA